MKRIGVLMGGPSSEHDVSLMTGLNILRALEGRFDAVPIFVAQSGEWFFGKNKLWVNPGDALARVDAVFNAMHGEYGEDGTVQKILSHHQIPYTGSEALPSSLAMNKDISGQMLESRGIRVPRSVVLGPTNIDTRPIIALSPPPWIIKPRGCGSSVGVSKVHNMSGLADALRSALKYDSYVMAQEFIPGREITCGVLENFSGKRISALAPIEIIPPEESDFFDYTVKYNGKTKEICPADFHGAMLAHIQDTAVEAHSALGLRHYSRTDMILKPSDKTRRAPELYVLEVNTLPGLTGESLFPKAARHAGLEFPDLVSHLVKLTGVV